MRLQRWKVFFRPFSKKIKIEINKIDSICRLLTNVKLKLD